jgi:hypothetical protein
MHTAAAAVAWAEWAVWTCNTGNLLVTVERERTYRPLFFFQVSLLRDVRPLTNTVLSLTVGDSMTRGSSRQNYDDHRQ